MTPFVKKKDIKKDWYIIDAENAAVGRLAAYISKVLRGKNKPTFNPHIDNGDFVVVTNVDKIKFSGKKFKEKIYYRHTGHPGGIKETTPEDYKNKSLKRWGRRPKGSARLLARQDAWHGRVHGVAGCMA